jgi:hypothetical protein
MASFTLFGPSLQLRYKTSRGHNGLCFICIHSNEHTTSHMLPCITENCEMKNCADCVIENATGKKGDPKGDLGRGTLGKTEVGGEGCTLGYNDFYNLGAITR